MEETEKYNFIEAEIAEDLKSGVIKEVVTRCPPEPTGYWHIGHCKAWIIDFETALKFDGYTNLRMDDTNPTKEDGEFTESYLEDLKWLGYTPKKLVYASEAYFEDIYKIAEKLITDGKAYVCNLTQEEMLKQKGTLTESGINSPYRNRDVQENLKLFRDMRAGKYKDGEITLRAKIDMAHPNILMRDPVMYRVLRATHYRVGDKWCIYPMYDFAHPMQDALEGVTYSLCDRTFRVHRELYEWFITHGWGRKPFPKQREFGALNIENVLIGKRYLKQLVNSGKVDGWDDPRLMTIVGMRRRGYTANAIKNFILSMGVTKDDVTVPFSALEHFIRDDLNKTAIRVMAVLNPLKVIITNFKGQPEKVVVQNNPNDESAGSHSTLFGNVIYIEQDDFSDNPPPKYNRLVPGGMVRLKGAYIIRCNNVVYDKSGKIEHLECEYLPETKSGGDESGIKVKGTIHFVSEDDMIKVKIREFGSLIKNEFLWPQKELSNGKNLEEMLEPDSKKEYTAICESFILKAKPQDKFQFIRNGYYCIDKDSEKENVILNKTIDLKNTFEKK